MIIWLRRRALATAVAGYPLPQRLSECRGWDDLFNKCSENLNSLTAMKLSPYYKVFEEEAGSWEEKLNRIHGGPGKLPHMFGRSDPRNRPKKCYLLGPRNAIPDNIGHVRVLSAHAWQGELRGRCVRAKSVS